ncbi:MAG: GlxA family transcriptional regulator [Pseudomonadota bacterium]
MDALATKPSGLTKKHFVFFLAPNFSMIAFAMAMEPLRLTNRYYGREIYTWRLVSGDGEPVRASNNVVCSVDGSLDEERGRIHVGERPDMIFVCAGVGVESYKNKTLNGWIKASLGRGISLAGLCTGAWILADAGLLDGRRCAIHWETLPGFSERFPEADVYADLFEYQDNIYTCAGGTAALDLMLHLIDLDHDAAVVNRVCEMCLTDRVRNPRDRQRLPLRARLGVQNSKLLTIIELMEANLSEPISLLEIADYVGLSRRQIERLFHKNLGRSPARYYLELRLDRARHLLLQSNIPIVEVGVACGFVSASHFSKCYRELYTRSPQQERQQREAVAV